MTLKNFLFWLVTPLTLLIPAFYNDYPLVYSDTGTYIISGIDLFIPLDRPVMYGLFIRLFSLKFSLWLVIYFQSVIVTYILWKILNISTTVSRRSFVFILIILSWFTGLGWYSSQLMPDIFTFTTVGSLLLLCLPTKTSPIEKIVFILILVLSINVHLSNFPIICLLIALIFIIDKTNLLLSKPAIRFNYSLPLLTLVLAIAIGSVTNFAIQRTWKLSEGSHVFFMAKMLDSGVLKSFLDEKCPEKNYILCDCKDSLPADSRIFMWDGNSPLVKHGGWEKTRDPYNEILLGIITSPKHIAMYGYNSITSSISQLFQNELCSGIVSTWYRTPASPPYYIIKDHYPHEFNQYIQSRQNENLWSQELELDNINLVYDYLLIASCLFLLFVFTSKKIMDQVPLKAKLTVIILLGCVVFNAVVTASIVNVCDRFQSRISWVIVLSSIIVILSNGQLLQRIKTIVEKSSGS